MVRAPGASTPAAASASIHISQSSPPITATVSAISSSLAASIATCLISRLSVSSVRSSTRLPIGFSVDLCVTPVTGCVRRGAARL